MHFVYFVVLDKTIENGSPEKVIRTVETFLEENGFAGNQGFFARSKADWYNIGGRWSGILSIAKGDITEEALDKEFEKRSRDGHNHKSDDAMVLTKKIITYLKKNYSDCEFVDIDNAEELKINDLEKKDIGRWIVIVDYHR